MCDRSHQLAASKTCCRQLAAAIANAVYHATGKRVRDVPITLDKLLQ
jgi:CO/xanthine dehydrogenase Mo-binding subunit